MMGQSAPGKLLPRDPATEQLITETGYLDTLMKACEQIAVFEGEPSQLPAYLGILKNLLIAIQTATIILKESKFEERTTSHPAPPAALINPQLGLAYLSTDSHKRVALSALTNLFNTAIELITVYAVLDPDSDLNFETLPASPVKTLADLLNPNNVNSPFTQAMQGFTKLSGPNQPAAATAASPS